MKLKQKIGGIFDKLSSIKPDRRVMVFLFFLVVSTIFWFLSALGKEYTTNLRYPVRYTNFPDKMVMVGDLPSSLELTINAYGYTLLKYYISRTIIPIVFDVNSFALNRLPDSETRNFYILSSVASARISGQLGADIQILDIRPDTLLFRFTEMVTRILPVRPVTDIEFEQQFMISDTIIAEPDSVAVSGPASLIDSMRFIPTVPLILKGLSKSARKAVNLAEYDMVSYSERRVWLNIPVEQFTEATTSIPIETVNLPDNLMLKTFPPAVRVSYLVSLTDYDRVNLQQFRAVVDYNALMPDGSRLTVKILKQPDFIKMLRFYPQSVDFVIETSGGNSRLNSNRNNENQTDQ